MDALVRKIRYLERKQPFKFYSVTKSEEEEKLPHTLLSISTLTIKQLADHLLAGGDILISIFDWDRYTSRHVLAWPKLKALIAKEDSSLELTYDFPEREAGKVRMFLT